jgi:hypothetical protein
MSRRYIVCSVLAFIAACKSEEPVVPSEAFVVSPRSVVLPVLKQRAAFENVPEAQTLLVPFTDSLVWAFVVDNPTTMRFVTADMVPKLGREANELMRGAGALLDERSRDAQVVPGPSAGSYCVKQVDDYTAPRIGSTTVRTRLEQAVGGPPVFAVPTRNLLCAVRGDHASDMRSLQAWAGSLQNERYALTGKLVRFDGATYSEFDAL